LIVSFSGATNRWHVFNPAAVGLLAALVVRKPGASVTRRK